MYDVASLIVTATVLPFTALVALCLRFYVRLKINPTYLGIDDWLIAIGFVFVCGQCANQIAAATIGEYGRDGEPIDNARLVPQSKLDYAVLIFEKVTYTTIKLSVLFFYRRIFESSRAFKIANNTLIVLIIIWGLTFLFVPAFLCGADSHHGHPCPATEWSSLWFGITDVLGDVAILALPYPCLKALQMDKRQKIGVIAIFMMGTLSLITGIVRLGFVTKTFAVYFHPSEYPTSPSRTPPGFWTTIEVCTGVIAACLPPCGPLLRRGAQRPWKLYRTVSERLTSRASGPSSGKSHHDRSRASAMERIPSFAFGGSKQHSETGREKYEMAQVEEFGAKDMV